MSITRQQLKSIVKECLVEILSEGIGTTSTRSITSESTVRKPVQASRPVSSPRRGENVKYAQTMAETIKRESKGNPVMAEIFADTAKNTLPTMLSESQAQQPPVTGKIEQIVSQHNPEDLFGDEAASKWAELAFAETPKKF